MSTLSIPFINVNTNQISTSKEFSLIPCRSKDNVKGYNEYCHKFKKHIAEILLQLCKRHIIDFPSTTKKTLTDSEETMHQKRELCNTFIKQNNYTFMIPLNADILSDIISFIKYHLARINILDRYKILNYLYLTLSFHTWPNNTLYNIKYCSLISFITSMLNINVGTAEWIQKQKPNSTWVPSYIAKHNGDLSHLWVDMLYVILKNGANPLLPSFPEREICDNNSDINKLKKYFWCFDKKVNPNLNAPQNFHILNSIAFCGRNHKYHKLIIDIINKYPSMNNYYTPFYRPAVFTFCVRNYENKIDTGTYVADKIWYFGGAISVNIDEIYFKYKVQDFINLITCCTRSKIIQFIDKNKIKNKNYYNLRYDLDEMMDSRNQLNKFKVMKESDRPQSSDGWGDSLAILEPQHKTLLFTIKEIQKYTQQMTKDYLFKNSIGFMLNNDIIECIIDEYVFEDMSYLNDDKIINQNKFLCCWFDGIADCNVEWFMFFHSNVLNKLNKESKECLRKHLVSNPSYVKYSGFIKYIKDKCHGCGSMEKALALTERIKFMFEITNMKYFGIPFVDENIALKIYKHHHGGPTLPNEYFQWARTVHIY